MNQRGDMKGDKHKTRRLHLLTNPNPPDVFMGMADDAAPESPRVIPTARARSYWAHPSQSGLSAVS
jgi:hypothetical protein